MDDKKAKDLLQKIRQKKAEGEDSPLIVKWLSRGMADKVMSAATKKPSPIVINASKMPQLSPIARWIRDIGSAVTPTDTRLPSSVVSIGKKLQAEGQKDLHNLALNNIINSLIIAGGLGAGARGVHQLLNPPKQVDIEKDVENMPVTIPDYTAKAAEDPVPDVVNFPKSPTAGEHISPAPTTPYGLHWYLPSMLLGTPLAAYAGWKGIDSLLGAQQKAKSDDELERMKARYQAAMQELVSSGKTAEDATEKEATLAETIVNGAANLGSNAVNAFNSAFPNARGIGAGLTLAYILGTAPLGYMAMASRLKESDKRKLLEKAVEERARRHEAEQPTALYALPR